MPVGCLMAISERDKDMLIMSLPRFRQLLFSEDRDLTAVFARDTAEADYVRLSVTIDSLIDKMEDPNGSFADKDWRELDKAQRELSVLFRGSKKIRKVLTDNEVKQIKKALELGRRQVDVARDYGASRSLINSIATGRNRKNI